MFAFFMLVFVSFFFSNANAKDATATQAVEARADLTATMAAKNWPGAEKAFQKLFALGVAVSCNEWGNGFVIARETGDMSVALARARSAQTEKCPSPLIQANIDHIQANYGLVQITGRSLTYNAAAVGDDGKIAQVFAATTLTAKQTFEGLLPVTGNNAQLVQYTVDGQTFIVLPIAEHPYVQHFPVPPPTAVHHYRTFETLFSAYLLAGTGSNADRRLSASWQAGGSVWLRPLGDGSLVSDVRLGRIEDNYSKDHHFEGAAGVKWEDSFHVWKRLTVTPMSGLSMGWGSLAIPCSSRPYERVWCGDGETFPTDFTTRLSGFWIGPELGGNITWQTSFARLGVRVLGNLEFFPANPSVISVTNATTGQLVNVPLWPTEKHIYARPTITVGPVVEFSAFPFWEQRKKPQKTDQ